MNLFDLPWSSEQLAALNNLGFGSLFPDLRDIWGTGLRCARVSADLSLHVVPESEFAELVVELSAMLIFAHSQVVSFRPVLPYVAPLSSVPLANTEIVDPSLVSVEDGASSRNVPNGHVDCNDYRSYYLQTIFELLWSTCLGVAAALRICYPYKTTMIEPEKLGRGSLCMRS